MLYLYPYYLRAKNIIFMCSYGTNFFLMSTEFEENKKSGIFTQNIPYIKKIMCASFITTALSLDISNDFYHNAN